MKVTRIGLDIAKQIYELHGVDRRGRVVVRKTLRRERVLEYFSQLPACEVALEACGGARYWQREIGKLGHTVRLLPTNKVKPYLDGNKNNAHDAAAIYMAATGSTNHDSDRYEGDLQRTVETGLSVDVLGETRTTHCRDESFVRLSRSTWERGLPAFVHPGR